jgi:hypothetical protein
MENIQNSGKQYYRKFAFDRVTVCHRCTLLLRRVGHELTVADGRQVSDENTRIEAQENWGGNRIPSKGDDGTEGGTSVGGHCQSTQPREELLIMGRSLPIYRNT